VTVTSLGNPILLGGVRSGGVVADSMDGKIIFKGHKLTTIVRVNRFYFALELCFNKMFKLRKDGTNTGLGNHGIKPHIFDKVINQN
jgi:hypothetical protein